MLTTPLLPIMSSSHINTAICHVGKSLRQQSRCWVYKLTGYQASHNFAHQSAKRQSRLPILSIIKQYFLHYIFFCTTCFGRRHYTEWWPTASPKIEINMSPPRLWTLQKIRQKKKTTKKRKRLTIIRQISILILLIGWYGGHQFRSRVTFPGQINYAIV